MDDADTEEARLEIETDNNESIMVEMEHGGDIH